MLLLPTLFVAAVGALQTPFAKAWVCGYASGMLSDLTPFDVTVHGLTGFLPFTIGLEELTMADDQGVWLTAEGSSIRVSAGSFLRGQVRAGAVRLASLDIQRRPVPREPEEVSPTPETITFPAIPEAPAWLRVDEFTVEQVSLGPSLLGEPLTLRVEGHYGPGPAAQEIGLKISRTDDVAGLVTLDAGLGKQGLKLALAVEDEGLVGKMVGVAGLFTFSLRGEGLLEDWKGQAIATLANADLVETDIRLDYGDALGLSVDGHVNAAHPLVPDQARTALEGASLDFKADARLTQDRILALNSISLVAGSAALDAKGTVSLSNLAMDLTLAARHGNVNKFMSKADSEESLSVSLNLTASGTPARLALTLDGALAGEQALHGQWLASLDESPSLKGSLEIQPVQAVSVSLRAFLEEGVNCAVDAAMNAPGQWTVNAFEARLAAGTLSATGKFDIEAAQIEGSFNAALLDAAKLNALLPVVMQGAALVSAKVGGGQDGIKAVVDITADGLVIDKTRIASAKLRFDTEAGWVDDPLAKLRIRGGGDVLGVQPEGFDPQDMTIDIDAETMEGENLLIRRAVIASPLGTADAQGTVNLKSRAGDLTAALDVPMLAPILAVARLQGTGSVRADLNLHSRDPWPALTGEAHVVAGELAGLPGNLDALLGGNVVIDVSGGLEGEQAKVPDLLVQAPNVSASGQSTYHLGTRQLVANLQGEVKDLAPLSSLVGEPLAGSVQYTALLEGTLDTLTAKLRLDATNPALAMASLESLHLEGEASGLPESPSGSLVFSGARGESRIDARARVVSDGKNMAIRELCLEAGPNRISGKGDLNLGTYAVTAALDVALSDLSYIGTLTDMPLKGDVTAEVRCRLEEGVATVLANLEGVDIETPYGNAAAARGDADIHGPENLAVSQFAVDMQEVTFGETKVTRLVAGAHGTLDEGIALYGSLQGFLPGNISLDTTFGATLSEKGSTLALAKLEGNLGTFPFDLSSPASLSWREGQGEITLDTLNLGEGRIGVQGTYGSEAIDFNAEWEQLPLALAEFYRDMPVTGHSDGSLNVAGSPARPRVALASRVYGMRSPEMDDRAAGMDTTVDAALADGVLSAEVQARLPEALTLDFNLAVPATFRMEPFAFGLPPGVPITGSLRLNSDLAPAIRPFQLAGHEVSGKANADLTIGGTLAKPMLTGQASVANGGYTNTLTGTMFKDLELLVKADGRRVFIEKLQASGPASGSIEGTGEFALPEDAPFTYSMRTNLREFRIADWDDFTGILNGEIVLEGNSEGASVSGAMVLGPASIRMPGQLPPAQLTPVDIEMPGRNGAGPEGAMPGFSDHIKLDLRVSSPGRVLITGPVLKTEWQCDLHAVGTAADPRLDGSLGVVQGNMDFLGRRFNLAESTITFDKSRPPDPFLDIKATSQANDITALLNLNGTMDNLHITLNSDPSFPEDEVLALVLFGKSLTDITPMQALQLVRVAEMLRGGGSGRSIFAGDVRSPRLDHFDVKPGGASGETSVVAGQYVTEKIYVELEQGSGREASKVQVEAQLSPQFSLKGTAESAGGNGLGLFWKRDY
jgi:translocation and assembly module TamB